MKHNFFKTITAVLMVMLLISVGAWAQNIDPKVTEVAKDLYMISGLAGSGNVAFFVTGEGVLVVDSGELPVLGKTIVDLIKKKTKKPVTHMIFTHYHYDHTYGINGFPKDIKIIGHANVVKNIESLNKKRYKEGIEKNYPAHLEKLKQKLETLKAKKDPKAKEVEKKLKLETDYFKELKTVKIKVPTMTFDDKMTITLGGEKIQLIYPGNAHTRGNCLVYFPKQKVIHMGDILFQGSYPYLDIKGGTNTRNWISALEDVTKMDVEKVIPGHGVLTSKKDVHVLSAYLADLRKAVKKEIKKGVSLDKMKKELRFPTYKHFKWAGLRAQNIHQVYLEITEKKK